MQTQAIVCKPGEDPKVIDIASDNTEALLDIVGGYLTVVPQRCLASALRGLTVYVNEEASDLPLNTLFWEGLPLYGSAVITKTDEDGDDIGLTTEEIQRVLAYLA